MLATIEADKTYPGIRAHASRATRKALDDVENVQTAPASSSGQGDPENNCPLNESASSHHPTEPFDPHYRPWTPESHAVRPSSAGGETQIPRSRNAGGQSTNSDSPALTGFDAGTIHTLPPYPTSRHFSTQGSTIGTWWERYPGTQGTYSGFNSFDPHKRSRVLREQEESNVLRPTSTPEQVNDQEQRVFTDDRAQQPPSCTPPSGSDSPQPTSADEKGRLKKKSSALKLLKHKKSAQQRMQSRWRVGNGPSKSLVLPTEHPHTQFETVLHQCSNFYHNAYETVWEPLLREQPTLLEAQSDYEMFYESTLSAAALIEAGQVNKAAHVIQCILEMLVNLMHQSHPQAYYFFLNLSLQTSSSALAQLRSKMKRVPSTVKRKATGAGSPHHSGTASRSTYGCS